MEKEIDLLQVLSYIVENPQFKSKSRKRKMIDRRNYLMGLLYHEFDKTHIQIGKLFERDRATVIHALKHITTIQFHDSFLKHTKKERLAFPYVFPEDKKARNVRIETKLTKENWGKLKTFMSDNNITEIDDAISEILNLIIQQ